jgi:hypothetical protein
VRLENDPEIKSIHHLALIIIDQCSRIFFDRTKPLDQRPEVIDLFNSAIGRVTEYTTIAFSNFWRHTDAHSRKSTSAYKARNSRYLDINPEGMLLRESRDLVEELRMMQQVFNQQHQVVKDFKRHLGLLSGDIDLAPDSLPGILEYFVAELAQKRSSDTAPLKSPIKDPRFGLMSKQPLDDTVQEADVQLELIQSRQAEIQDLKDSALHTCQQVLLRHSLKGFILSQVAAGTPTLTQAAASQYCGSQISA